MDVMNDLPLVASCGRLVKWLDQLDASMSYQARQEALAEIGAELRALQKRWHEERPEPRNIVSDDPMYRHTMAGIDRIMRRLR